jgi:PPOX class probable F420-dependent enzyme
MNRLKDMDQKVGWVATVDSNNCPHVVPVWFVVNSEGQIVFFSEPGTQKINNLKQNPAIAFHLEGALPGQVRIVRGVADMIWHLSKDSFIPDVFEEKYGTMMAEREWTRSDLESLYTMEVRIRQEVAAAW